MIMPEEYLPKAVHDEFVERMRLECIRLADEDHRQNERLSELERQQKQITELTISVRELASNMKSMLQEQTEQGNRLKVLENRDGEKWRGAVKTVITVVLTAAVTAALAFFGLK